MKRQNKVIGGIGERVAEQYLTKIGYSVILRNFSTRYGEIDLIMSDKSIIVFVEVKTKTGNRFGSPEEMFTKGKYLKVRRMATLFLRGKDVPCRIDMVAVDLQEEMQPVVRHYMNVMF